LGIGERPKTAISPKLQFRRHCGSGVVCPSSMMLMYITTL
jgi:hypothetical protein